MPHVAAGMASRDCWQRHRPGQILLYQLVEEYCLALAANLAERGRELPG